MTSDINKLLTKMKEEQIPTDLLLYEHTAHIDHPSYTLEDYKMSAEYTAHLPRGKACTPCRYVQTHLAHPESGINRHLHFRRRKMVCLVVYPIRTLLTSMGRNVTVTSQSATNASASTAPKNASTTKCRCLLPPEDLSKTSHDSNLVSRNFSRMTLLL